MMSPTKREQEEYSDIIVIIRMFQSLVDVGYNVDASVCHILDRSANHVIDHKETFLLYVIV